MRNFGTALLMALGFACLVFLGGRFFERHRPYSYAAAHAVGRALGELRQVGNALEVAFSSGKKRPDVRLEDGRVVVLSGRELYLLLVSDDFTKSLIQGQTNWFQKEAICDAWGKEIMAEFRLVKGRVSLKVRSFGPNRVDDKGSSDDLTYALEFEANGSN